MKLGKGNAKTKEKTIARCKGYEIQERKYLKEKYRCKWGIQEENSFIIIWYKVETKRRITLKDNGRSSYMITFAF